jgi:DNA mismatch endonuclease (patch repair protein)
MISLHQKRPEVNLTDPVRSRIMSSVKQKNTGPETIVRQTLHALGFRFRLHKRGLPGTPDIVLSKYKTVIFIHGCFWHRHSGCAKATMPKTRVDFWQEKFYRNVERDRRNQLDLLATGWNVIVVWECETRDLTRLRERLLSTLIGEAVINQIVSPDVRLSIPS